VVVYYCSDSGIILTIKSIRVVGLGIQMRIFNINRQKILASTLKDAINYFLRRNPEYKASLVEVEDVMGKKKAVKTKQEKENK
jgi:hypothetical protein